jgi:PadR family transcriptional regulator PadR
MGGLRKKQKRERLFCSTRLYVPRNRLALLTPDAFQVVSPCHPFYWTPPIRGAIDQTMDFKLINREILLSFWKIHILHHAAEADVIGQWMLKELHHHGYDVSPGTLYPLLKRMEANGWLVSTADPARGPKGPRAYRITAEGRQVLKVVRKQLRELGVEVSRD